MKMVTTHNGFEWDWVAEDEASNIGYFSSAGDGPVPDVSIEQIDADILDITECVMSLPVIGNAHWMPGSHVNAFEWYEVARRGLFAFDWNRSACLYVLVAMPEVSLRAEALAQSAFRDHLRGIRLPTVFARSNQLEPALHAFDSDRVR